MVTDFVRDDPAELIAELISENVDAIYKGIGTTQPKGTTTNLELWHSFDEPTWDSTVLITGISGNTIPLTVTDGIERKHLELYNESIYRDIGERIYNTAVTGLPSLDDFTIQFYFKIDVLKGSKITLFSMTNTVGASSFIYFNYDDTTENITLDFFFSSGLAQGFTISNALVVDNWYHLAVIREGTAIRTYLDSSLIDTDVIDTLAIDFSSGTTKIGIGEKISDGSLTADKVYFDEVMIHSAVLTAVQLGVYLSNPPIPQEYKPVTFSTDWFLPDDNFPAINIIEVMNAPETHHLSGNHILDKIRVKVAIRSHDKRHTHPLREMVKRILITNRLNPTSTSYTNAGVQFMRVFSGSGSSENKNGKLVYRKDLDVELFRQASYY